MPLFFFFPPFPFFPLDVFCLRGGVWKVANGEQVLEDYEKQLLHLKKEVETINTDFEQWEKDKYATT